MSALGTICAAAAIALTLTAVAVGWGATGPGCPGMDPQWAGWCE